MKYLYIIILLVISGLGGYYFGVNNISNITSCPGPDVVKRVTEHSYQGELNKAKEYYGKAFVLFLANIGLELSRSQNSDLKQIIEDPKKYTSLRPTQNKVTTNDNNGPEVVILSDDLANTNFGDFVLKTKANIEHINDRSLIDKNSSFILKDPGLYYIRSKFIKSYQAIKPFNGIYSGKLYLFLGKHKGETHDIELSVEYNDVNDEDNKDKVDGSFSLKISEDGNIYSHNRGNGGNGNIRLNKSSLIIEASPSSFFHFQNNQIETANYYDNNKLVGFSRFRKLDE